MGISSQIAQSKNMLQAISTKPLHVSGKHSAISSLFQSNANGKSKCELQKAKTEKQTNKKKIKINKVSAS